MTCKKCGAQMRLWLLRPGYKSLACPSCEFVAIVRDETEGRTVAGDGRPRMAASGGRACDQSLKAGRM